jgi:hypothetical protein
MAESSLERAHTVPTPATVYKWVGKWVLIKYMTGPSLNTEDLDEVVTGPPQARTGLYSLQEVSSLGIVAVRNDKDPGAFIPWSAVLVVVGPPEQKESAGDPSSVNLTPQ